MKTRIRRALNNYTITTKGTVFSRVSQKLRTNSGETLVETLVSVLITGLAIMLLTGSIVSAANMTKAGEEKMSKYYEESNKLVAQTASATDLKGKMTLTMDTAEGAYASDVIAKGKEKVSCVVNVSYFMNEESVGDTVISYSRKK